MGDRSITASERQRLLADKADRDRIEGLVVNEIRKVPMMVSGGIADHLAAADPHSQYATDADLAAHVAAADPHPGYLTPAEGNAAYTPLSHVGAGGAAHANVVAGGAAGFISGADKTKLDGIASGATAYTDALARSAVVVDSIADADTDHAPSRNAVFDALALKKGLIQLIAAHNAAYTLALSDIDQMLYHSVNSTHAWTIPANASVAFPVGSLLHGVNYDGAITLTRDAGVTLYWLNNGGAAAPDANRTVNKASEFTLWQAFADVWFVWGNGLT